MVSPGQFVSVQGKGSIIEIEGLGIRLTHSN